MTPLTHAAVATLICQQTRRLRCGGWKWSIALAMVFASHFLLDSIPHFEGVVPIQNYKRNVLLMVGMGSLGMVLAALLMRWNREVGRVWLVLFLWIALGFYTFSWWRILTAAIALAYIAWKSPLRQAVFYTAAGMISVLPDLMPPSLQNLTLFHRSMHYSSDWSNLVYLYFSDPPVPRTWQARLQSPPFLLAYGLELAIEGLIFVLALYFLARDRLAPEMSWQSQLSESAEFSARTEVSPH